MDLKLLTAAALAAALALPSTPGSAQEAMSARVGDGHSGRFIGVPGVRHDFGPCRDGDRRDRDRRDVRRDGRFRCAFDGFAYADGEWALYNNRSWDPDSYNDWWNDRPDRAFPRWVQEQHARGTCEPDRMWWSGSGWHC